MGWDGALGTGKAEAYCVILGFDSFGSTGGQFDSLVQSRLCSYPKLSLLCWSLFRTGVKGSECFRDSWEKGQRMSQREMSMLWQSYPSVIPWWEILFGMYFNDCRRVRRKRGECVAWTGPIPKWARMDSCLRDLSEGTPVVYGCCFIFWLVGIVLICVLF